MVVTPLPKIENGYFSLKNARNSSLKRVTATAKIAIDKLMSSIVVSLCEIPPLSLKNSKKKPISLKRWAISHKVSTFFRLPLSGRVIISKKYKNITKLSKNLQGNLAIGEKR